MQRIYFVYLSVIAVFAGIACTHGGALILLIAVLPLGLLTIAAPTILTYSLVLVPSVAFWSNRSARMFLMVAAAVIAIAIAVLPGLLSEHAAKDFAARMGAQDFDRPMPSKPRSIELAGDPSSGMWVYGHSVGEKAAGCNEICTRLLMNGEVDWVRMTTMPGGRRSSGPQSVIYRLEHREACPELVADHSVEKVLRDRLVAGDCLIAAPDHGLPPDAIIRLTTRYEEASNLEPPGARLPGYIAITSVKMLEIESHQDGAALPVLKRTETVARPLALPFYFGAKLDMQCGNCNGPTIGRDTVVTQPIDLTRTLRQTLGYVLADISAGPPEAPRQVAEAILKLPPGTASSFSKQQQDVLNDTLQVIAKKPEPSDADVGFIRRVVSDDRVTNGLIGISIQNMSRRNPGWIEFLIPTILDRMQAPIDQQNGHYKSALGWSLQSVPVGKLQPYRDRIIGIVTTQPDWTTNGLLVRLAELGGNDALGLVIRQLDAKPKMDSPRQFAAIAICRADADAWPRLEPVALAHLSSGRPNRIDDDEAALLLALVRFGEKAQAIDIVQRRSLKDDANVIDRLNKFDRDFDLKHYRDRL